VYGDFRHPYWSYRKYTHLLLQILNMSICTEVWKCLFLFDLLCVTLTNVLGRIFSCYLRKLILDVQPAIEGPYGLTYWELLYLMPRYISWILPHPIIHLRVFLWTSHLFPTQTFSNVLFILTTFPYFATEETAFYRASHPRAPSLTRFMSSLPRIMCVFPLSWRWRQKVYLMSCYIATKLHGITPRKASHINIETSLIFS
jgi:hypothetical protein